MRTPPEARLPPSPWFTGEPSPVVPQPEALARGIIAAWDPDYRERLGLGE